MEYIKKEDMQDYCIYYCDARNFNFGIWYDNKMHGIRHKWGDSYLDTEYHWDDGIEGCGTCKPFKQLTASLKDRIHPSFFDFRNWRGQTVLHDILYPFEMLDEKIVEKFKDEENVQM